MVAAVLERRKVVADLVKQRGDMLVVSGLGSPSWDLFAAGDHEANFYLWGAMGGAAMVGLGLAQAQPDRPVLVITGDGELLMGLGSLATIGAAQPANLTIAVLDNESYGETGMQASHTQAGVDLCAVAAACGFAQVREITDEAEMPDLPQPANGAAFYLFKITADIPARALPSRDAVYLKNRFRAGLGFAVE